MGSEPSSCVCSYLLQHEPPEQVLLPAGASPVLCNSARVGGGPSAQRPQRPSSHCGERASTIMWCAACCHVRRSLCTLLMQACLLSGTVAVKCSHDPCFSAGLLEQSPPMSSADACRWGSAMQPPAPLRRGLSLWAGSQGSSSHSGSSLHRASAPLCWCLWAPRSAQSSCTSEPSNLCHHCAGPDLLLWRSS